MFKVQEVSFMYSKILILRFPKEVVHKPLVCHLVRDYDLTFNILDAEIFPRKEGMLVLELSGGRKNFRQGVKFLEQHGVAVQSAEQEVRKSKQRCVHCGACTAVCPSGALYIKRPEMSVEFDQKKCSVCELCFTACPTKAMSIRPKNQAFFE
jgi:ferredoxin